MKKLLAVILTLTMLLLGSSITASAEEIALSLKKDDLKRGQMAYKTMVYNKEDGSLVTDGQNISFPLPETVTSGQSITVRIKGTSDSDFRVWLIDANETTVSNQYKMTDNGYTPGTEFDHTFVLTHDGVGPDATELFFKAPTWDGKIENLNLTYVAIVVGGDAAATPTEATTTDAAATEASASKTPKTGVQSNAVAYLVLMAVATVGFVATRKKVLNK